ncbi:beta-propeller fold lactonase family protein [Bdellovibrio sp. HCB337]|uniref:YncE family protein n=1 Tax=Bdellovibrio sp. HCB337 TaxID=3394358 RepID=UPI0039A53EF9
MKKHNVLAIIMMFFSLSSAFAQEMISLEGYARISYSEFPNKLPVDIRDKDISSPKSVRFSADAKKIYINSLEGGKTVIYSWPELQKLKTIRHRFTDKNAALFQGETTVFDYPYFIQPPTGDVNQFMGKPVESELSADGRYLWVPYYRRDWDSFGQSPGAIAIIDTQTDEIVRVMPTGPIPKYVTASPDGKYVAVIHWGDNTVGLIDTSSGDPRQYNYVTHLTVEQQLSQVGLENTDRDKTCGFCLRGSVFTPDSQYLIVARMGKGGIAGFHIPTQTYLGTILNIASTPRHLVLSPDGSTIYASSNISGYVSKAPLVDVVNALVSAKGKRIQGPKWKSAFVGVGARTLDISPKGKYIFVAVNNTSELVTLNAQTLEVLSKINVDPYAVGLAVAPDLSAVILTSQGRPGQGGGNTVNIIRVHANESDALQVTPLR